MNASSLRLGILLFCIFSISQCDHSQEQAQALKLLLRPPPFSQSACTEQEKVDCWEQLKKKHGLVETEEGLLREKDGRFFRKRTEIPKLQQDLEVYLKDPEKAEKIFRAYIEELQPFFSEDEQNEFEKFLRGSPFRRGNARIFVSPYVDIKPRITRVIEEQHPALVPHLTSILQFVEKLSEKKLRKRDERKDRRILVLTSGSGGGHVAPAESFVNYINTKQSELNASARLVILEKEFGDNDPFFSFTGMHVLGIYDEMFQKQKDSRKTTCFWNIARDIERNYYPDSTVAAVKKLAYEEKADLIVSFMFFFMEGISVAYELGVPYYTVATDFSMLSQPAINFDNFDPALIKFLVPTDHPHFLKEDVKFPILRKEREAIAQFIENRSSFSELRKDVPVLDVLGYPLRPEMEKMADLAAEDKVKTRQKVRENLHVRPEAKMIMLMMGAAGDKAISAVVDAIVEQEKTAKMPLDFFVLTGKNTELRRELTEKASKKKRDIFRIIPIGFQDAQSMAELYLATDLLLTKPGGSTTAEVLRFGVQTLVVGYYVWEKANYEFMRLNGIGAENLELRNLVSDIMKSLAKKPPQRINLPNWKQNTARLLIAI